MSQKDNVKQFIKMSQELPPAYPALQDDRKRTGQQGSGSGVLSTLLGLGALGAGGYAAYRWGPRLAKWISSRARGLGRDPREIASQATEAEQVLQKATEEGTLPDGLDDQVRRLAIQMIGDGDKKVQDVVNTVRSVADNYALGDRSWIPGRVDPLWGDARDALTEAFGETSDLPYTDPYHVIKTRGR